MWSTCTACASLTCTHRWWKGNISVQLPGHPATTPTNGPIGCGDAPPHLIPPEAEPCTKGPTTACHATTHEPASLTGKPTTFQSECAGTESVAQEEDIPSAAAVAAGRVGSAPGVLLSISSLRSRRPSSVVVHGVRPAIKPLSSPGASVLRQDDSRRVQWVCSKADPEDATSMPCPFKQVTEDTTASPVPSYSR
ncbi:hypothetical protein DUNSADRAFT_13829 [Dunaliella salina]|uniref:Encoded protein n=1 Tax=Dunaliella salina TaxID=3046 RepID=A0ABQ7G8K1_DUNSA|nr:hypothetical protein DUNSADRAFT_13829 [Dunaliella salina]|eukprot:KAF5830921.1 hypothetical protein DUNSADRAFT_13829 [Dunaliella salina]